MPAWSSAAFTRGSRYLTVSAANDLGQQNVWSVDKANRLETGLSPFFALVSTCRVSLVKPKTVSAEAINGQSGGLMCGVVFE